KTHENELSKGEEQEKINISKEYMESICSCMSHHMERMKEGYPEGNGVTTEKLIIIQKKKGLHNRNDNF
ncbi:DUF896 domain-containing protein, partial [Enterococcus faecium]|uniref:DUF896 domain-containing protein n=1 Tax=Enterococcus faecium TaxID=1352 RepID=UPI0030C859E0